MMLHVQYFPDLSVMPVVIFECVMGGHSSPFQGGISFRWRVLGVHVERGWRGEEVGVTSIGV